MSRYSRWTPCFYSSQNPRSFGRKYLFHFTYCSFSSGVSWGICRISRLFYVTLIHSFLWKDVGRWSYSRSIQIPMSRYSWNCGINGPGHASYCCRCSGCSSGLTDGFSNYAYKEPVHDVSPHQYCFAHQALHNKMSAIVQPKTETCNYNPSSSEMDPYTYIILSQLWN